MRPEHLAHLTIRFHTKREIGEPVSPPLSVSAGIVKSRRSFTVFI